MTPKYFCYYPVILIVLKVSEYLVGASNRTGLNEDFQELVDRIKPEFEENLIRAFKNEAIRSQHIINKDWYIHEMDNVLISQEDTKIELGNLKFPWIPDFRITSFSINFNMLHLDIEIKLGDLRVEGDYEATSLSLLKVVPVTNVGKIEFSFNDVSGRGKVGLFIRGDSLVPENYDILYECAESSLTVKYYINGENEIENKRTRSKEDKDILIDAVWKQLREIINRRLDEQLGAAVVQFSVTELFEDEDEELRSLARTRSTQANRLFDSLLCTAKDYLVARNFRSIQCPPFNVIYRGKLPGIYQGTLHTEEGYLQDLSTLSRYQDLSLSEDSQKLTIYGTLTMKELKHGYAHYSSEFEGTEISGSIKATVYENKIFIKLSVLKQGERCSTNINDVFFNNIRDIDIDISGLASLSWLTPKLKSWVIGNLRYSSLSVLEKHIKEAFEYAISSTNCVSLLTM